MTLWLGALLRRVEFGLWRSIPRYNKPSRAKQSLFSSFPVRNSVSQRPFANGPPSHPSALNIKPYPPAGISTRFDLD